MTPPAKSKRTLHLKIGLAAIFAAFFPYILGLFIPLTSLLYLAAATISTILAIIFLFWILRPLKLLIKGTQDFSDGNLNRRLDLRSGDEFEEAGSSFNLMAEKLSKTIQAIENQQVIAVAEKNKFGEILSSVIDGIIALDFNKNILFFNKAAEELTNFSLAEAQGRKIDEIIHLFSDNVEILSKTYSQSSFNQTAKLIGKQGKQTKVHVMTAQVKATVQTDLNCILILHDLSREEELEQMKLDFVSMASHELKTPLTSIVGYLSVFLEENQKNIPKESYDLLSKAFTAAQQLQTLISNLLNVNKIEREQLSVTPAPTDFLPILTKSVDDLRSQANQKGIVLNLAPTDNLPKVIADPIRIGEVVTNLVANAINYTNAGGKVEISTIVSPTEVQTTVSDTGIGIPPQAIPHLFNKFFRVSNTEQKANKGTGLGLYISRSIIEKLHGKIWVESEVGKGSRFSFTLPVITQTAGSLDTKQFTSQAFQSGTLNY
jgi:PAS domain S-box-containing protein